MIAAVPRPESRPILRPAHEAKVPVAARQSAVTFSRLLRRPHRRRPAAEQSIAGYGVMSTPALVLDGLVIFAGRLPTAYRSGRPSRPRTPADRYPPEGATPCPRSMSLNLPCAATREC